MDWGDLGLTLAEILSPLLVAGLTWVSVKVADLVRAKVKNTYLEGTLVRLNDTVFTVVKDMNQTVVKGIKAAKDPDSPGGTSLTKEEKNSIKSQAMSEVKALLGIKGLGELAKVLGLSDGSVHQFIGAKIEAAVADTKPGKA